MVGRSSANLAKAPGDSCRPCGGTFHAVAHRHVAAYAEILGFAGGFSIMSPSEACDLMELIRGQFDLCSPERAVPPFGDPGQGNLFTLYLKNMSSPLHEILSFAYPMVPAPPGRHGSTLRSLHDPQKPGWAGRSTICSSTGGRCSIRRLARTWPAGRSCWWTSTRTSTACRSTSCGSLAPQGKGLTVVGDEAQAIYGFGGPARNTCDSWWPISPTRRSFAWSRTSGRYRAFSTSPTPYVRQRRASAWSSSPNAAAGASRHCCVATTPRPKHGRS